MKFLKISLDNRLQAELGHRGGRVLAVEAEHDVAGEEVGRARAVGAAGHAERGRRARRAGLRARRALGHHQLYLAEEDAAGHYRLAHVLEDRRTGGLDGRGVAAVRYRGGGGGAERGRPHRDGGRRELGRREDLVRQVTHVDVVTSVAVVLANRGTNGGHLLYLFIRK